MLSPIPAFVMQNIFQSAFFICYYFMYYERIILVSKREHSARFLSGGSSHWWWWRGQCYKFSLLEGPGDTCLDWTGKEAMGCREVRNLQVI